jgi:hypothetical protein
MRRSISKILALIFCVMCLVPAEKVSAEKLYLNVQEAVDMAMKNNTDFRKAEIDYEKDELKLERERQKLGSQVKQDYYALLYNNAKVELQEQKIRILDEHKRQMRSNRNRKMHPQADYWKTEVCIDNAKYDSIKAKEESRKASNQLANTMGVSPSNIIEPVEFLSFDRVRLSGDGCVAYAMMNRTDVISADNAIEKAKNKKKAEIEAEKLKNSVELAVTNAFAEVESAYQRIDLCKQSIPVAEKSYNGAKLRYLEGVDSNLNVIDAANDLTAIHIRYYEALYDYNVARARLSEAMGEPVETLLAPEDIKKSVNEDIDLKNGNTISEKQEKADITEENLSKTEYSSVDKQVKINITNYNANTDGTSVAMKADFAEFRKVLNDKSASNEGKIFACGLKSVLDMAAGGVTDYAMIAKGLKLITINKAQHLNDALWVTMCNWGGGKFDMEIVENTVKAVRELQMSGNANYDEVKALLAERLGADKVKRNSSVIKAVFKGANLYYSK